MPFGEEDTKVASITAMQNEIQRSRLKKKHYDTEEILKIQYGDKDVKKRLLSTTIT